MKDFIEQEIVQQGYTILRWKNSRLCYGWRVEVVKNGRYSTLYVNDFVEERLDEELQ